MNLRNYETLFILTPVLDKDQTQETIAKFSNFFIERKIEIVHEDPIGLKKLAYPIQHKSTGIYHLIEFKAMPDVVHALEIAYKRDEKVMRFLTFMLDKHGIDYNERKRNGTLSPKFETKQEVTV